MLYIFAGYPRSGLNAGGLQYAIEKVEEIAMLEHSMGTRYTKESPDHQLSPTLEEQGITWRWFSEGWGFGNGVTTHKSLAGYQTKLVVHGTDLSLEEFLRLGDKVNLAALSLSKTHQVTEGWRQYERRWTPGACPQESHLVHLTWLITKQPLPPLGYERIRELVEEPVEIDRAAFKPEHFSAIRTWKPLAEVCDAS